MAKGSNSGFKISIGLRYDELNKDFVDVGQTISENIQRLNRQNNLIDLKSRISLVGVNDEAKQLDILSQKLQKQVEIQRNKVLLYEDAANQANKAYGTENQLAQKAVYAYHQQRLELAQLNQQLSQVSDRQKQLVQSQPKSNPILAGYKGLKGDVSGALGQLSSAFNGLKTASQSADGAITKSLEIISSIPHPVGKAVAALAAIPLVTKGIENSLLDIARPAIAAGDAMYVMSRGMQISWQDMAKLSTISQVTGIEVSEVNSSLRRLSASITKADEKGNLASKTLQKYGASIKDTNGNIKQGTALVGELAKAFANARALGKGAEFRDAVGGRFWSADFVTFLEDYAGNVELAGKVIKNGLADPVKAHGIQGELNALAAQAKQLGGAWSSAFMPVTEHIVPHLRQRLGELTQVINDHSEGIKNVGYKIGDVVDKVGAFTTKVVECTVKVVDFFNKTGDTPDSALVDKFLDKNNKKYQELQKQLDEYSKIQLKIEKLQDDLNDAKASGKNAIIADLTEQIQDLNQKSDKAKYAVNNLVTDEITKSMTQGTQAAMRYNKAVGYYGTLELKRQADSLRITNELLDENNQKTREAARAAEEDAKNKQKEKEAQEALIDAESPQRIEKFKEELKKLKLDLKFGDNNYQKSLAELEQWYKEATRIAGTNWAERLQIEQLYKAKLEKIRQEPEKRVADLNAETANLEYERTHTAFEKQIRDIEQWKDAQLKKARTAEEVSAIIKNSAEKESKAFSDEMDKIKGKVQTLQEKIFEQEHSEKANKAMKIQKERAEMYEEGIYDPEDIERWYRNAAKKEKLGNLANIDFYRQVQANTNADMLRFGQAPQVPKQQNISAPDFKQLSQEFQDKLAAPIQIVSDSTNKLNISIGNVGGSFKSAANSAVILADSFQNVAKKLNSLKFNLPNDVNKIPTPTKNLPTANAPTKNLPQNLPAQQVTPVQQPKQTNDNTADKLKLAAQKVAGNNSAGDLTKNFSKDLTGITKQLADLTKIVGSIAQDSAKNLQSKPPQITVSPNININLGGAYVFDNAMKAQLTDDITTDVANAITEAIDSAAVKFNTSYSN